MMFEDTLAFYRDTLKTADTRSTAVQGLLWVYWTGRIDGTLALALRRLDRKATDELIARIGKTCKTQQDVKDWLWENRDALIA